MKILTVQTSEILGLVVKLEDGTTVMFGSYDILVDGNPKTVYTCKNISNQKQVPTEILTTVRIKVKL